MADDGDHVVFTEHGAANDDDAAWASASIDIAAFAGQTIRLRFEAVDAAGGNLRRGSRRRRPGPPPMRRARSAIGCRSGDPRGRSGWRRSPWRRPPASSRSAGRASTPTPRWSTDIQAVAAAHPDIVSLFSIGTSLQGPAPSGPPRSPTTSATDEAEPEVLFDGLHHAREHMSLEMTLKILHWLADGYGSDARITNIVDSARGVDRLLGQPRRRRVRHQGRQIPPVAQEPPAECRRRRAIGTDLNRNYDYRWGCCGGSSTNPASLMYRGAQPVLGTRDAARCATSSLSRVVDGWQQIRTHISFHTSGRLVMWPYGYTLEQRALRTCPGTTTRRSWPWARRWPRSTATARSRRSDLYITSGRFGDWLYGTPPRLHLHVRADRWLVSRRLDDRARRPPATARPSSTSSSRPTAPGGRRAWRRPTAAPSTTTSSSTMAGVPTRRAPTPPTDGTWQRGNPAGHRASTGPSSWAPPSAPRAPWSPASRPAAAPVPTTSTAA